MNTPMPSHIIIQKIKDQKCPPYWNFYPQPDNPYSIAIEINRTCMIYVTSVSPNGVQIHDDGWNLIHLPPNQTQWQKLANKYHIHYHNAELSITSNINHVLTNLYQMIDLLTDAGFDNLDKPVPPKVKTFLTRISQAMILLDHAHDTSDQTVKQLTNYEKKMVTEYNQLITNLVQQMSNEIKHNNDTNKDINNSTSPAKKDEK